MKRDQIRRVAIGAACSVVAASVVPALADFNDAKSGAWNAADTWTENAAPTAATDVVRIDQFTVGATIGATPTFTSGEVHLDGTGRLNITNNYTSYTAAGLNLKLNGGTFNGGIGSVYSGGTAQAIDVAGTSTFFASTAGDSTVIGSDTAPAVLSGAGTMVVQNQGTLWFQADGTVANSSTFSGTYDIHDSTVWFGHANMVKDASIVLNGGTSKVQTTFGAVAASSRSVVKNLSGTGKFEFSASNYSRDLVMTGALSPGTSTTAGTITRSTFRSGNDLKFNAGSTLEMDVFGPTQAEADQLVWKDSVSVSNLDLTAGELKVRLYTPTSDLPTTQWILVDGDELGAAGVADNDGVSTPAASGGFGTVTFVADPGWQNLQITYTGTAGSSNRQIILSGSFSAVPEPASLGMFSVGAMALMARRRGAK